MVRVRWLVPCHSPDAGVVALRQRIAGVADNATDVRAFSVSGHSRIAVAAPSSNTVTIFGHVSTESSTLKVVQTLSGTPPNPAIVLPFELGQRLFLFVASENVAADGALFIYDELSQQFLYNLTVSNTSACVDASFISGMTGANSTAGFLIVMRADIAGPASTTSRKLIWNETTDQVSVSSLLQGVSISDARGIETLVMPSTSNIRKVFVAFVSRSNASHGVEGSSVMISLFNTASGELQVVAVLPAMGATAATFMDIAGVPFLVVAEDGVPQNATLSNLTGGSTRIWREDASTGSWVEHQVVSTQALGFSGSVTWTAVWQSLQTKLSASQETLLLLAQSGMSRILRFRFPPGAPPEVALNAERGRFAPLGTIDVSADCAPGLRRWAFAPEFRKNTNPGLLVGIGSTALCVLEI